MPKLSDTKIRAAKPRSRPYKLYDGNGLYLIVNANGSKWWRQRFVRAGKEQTLSVGVYDAIGLAAAREKSDAIRAQLANGLNPSHERRERKNARADAATHTFKAVALTWIGKYLEPQGRTADHIQRVRRRFEVWFFPWIGHKSIGEVTEDDILDCLKRIEDRNLIDTAHRARAQCDQVFRYAKRRYKKLVKVNPVADLKGPDTLPPVRVKHHAGITDPAKLAPLLQAIEGYYGGFVVRCALRFLPLVFVRPGELRHAEWSEFRLEGREPEWRIPAAKMKMRIQHIVPLSRQAVEILRELQPLTGPDGLVFPSVRHPSRPMSDGTLNVALKSLGYSSDQQTPHGFRTTASTLLNERGFAPDAIERQLAHGEPNAVRAAYNSAEYLPERRKMMQAWADYIDKLRPGFVPPRVGRSKLNGQKKHARGLDSDG